MTAIISLLRGVNVGAHNRIQMGALRALYESLGLRDAQTYVQSGNVVFTTHKRDLIALAKLIEDAIARDFDFHPSVILRTCSELRDVIARNPFANRSGVEPSKLLVNFLASDPGAEVRDKVLSLKTGPEELRMDGRELYIYFPNGMARPKMSWAVLERTLKVSGTGRNWNSVTKLLEMAESVEGIEMMRSVKNRSPQRNRGHRGLACNIFRCYWRKFGLGLVFGKGAGSWVL